MRSKGSARKRLEEDRRYMHTYGYAWMTDGGRRKMTVPHKMIWNT
jgi:hypothetical protein